MPSLQDMMEEAVNGDFVNLFSLLSSTSTHCRHGSGLRGATAWLMLYTFLPMGGHLIHMPI